MVCSSRPPSCGRGPAGCSSTDATATAWAEGRGARRRHGQLAGPRLLRALRLRPGRPRPDSVQRRAPDASRSTAVTDRDQLGTGPGARASKFGMRRSAVLLALCLLAACAGSDDDTGGVALEGEVTTPSTITITETTSEEYPGPPHTIVTGGDKRLVLRPWTFCFGGLCADGSPPDEPLDIGTADSVHVQFAEPGLELHRGLQSCRCRLSPIVACDPDARGPQRLPVGPARPAG